MEEAPWSKLTADLLVEILARVDGPTLASAACSCKDLRRAAEEEALWQELCHGTWPSTRVAKAKKLVLSMPGGFARLYADSLPLLIYRRGQERRHGGAGEPAPATADLISFVDVYYKKTCVLSKVVFGAPLHDPAAGGFQPAVPFRLRVDSVDEDEETGTYPYPSFTLEPKEEGGVGVLSWMLEEELTLSWVLVDVKKGRAVNLAGRNPSAVLRSSSSGEEDIVVQFSCAVPVEPRLLPPDGVAKCVVSMGCRLSQAEEDSLSCSEIELQVADAEGAYLDGHRSLAVLQRALCSRTRTRTTNRESAEDGCRACLNGGTEGWRWPEVVAGKLCALSAVALLSGLCMLMF